MLFGKLRRTHIATNSRNLAGHRTKPPGLIRSLACAALLFASSFFLGSRPASGAPDSPNGMSGAGISGIQVVNFDSDTAAAISIDLFNQRGGPPTSIFTSSVAPGAVANFFLPAEAGLPNGAFAGIVRSDRPIAAYARADWTTSGGAVIYEQAKASTELILSLVAKDYLGQNTLINVQNADTDQAATVTVDVMEMGSKDVTASVEVSVAPGTSATLDMARSSIFAALPSGFLGWMRLTSDRPIAAVALVDQETSPFGVYDIAAVPATQASSRLAAPMLYNAWREPQRTSGVLVHNPGYAPVEVSLHYQGLDGSCAGNRLTHGPVTLAAGGSQIFYQANVDLPGSGASGLPEGCAASGWIEASGAVLAHVSISGNRDNVVAAYRAQPIVEAAPSLAVPVVRNQHILQMKISTDLHVSNAGQEAADVGLEIFDAGGKPIDCGADCQARLEAGDSKRWDLRALMPAGTYGTARLVASEAILAVALDGSDVGAVDDAIYLGLAPDPESPLRGLLPILLRSAGSNPRPTAAETRAPDPTITPGSPPPPTAEPTQRPVPGSDFDLTLVSGYQVLNLSPDGPLDLEMNHRLLGNSEVDGQIRRPSVAPGVAANIYLPSETRLSQGAHSVRIEAGGGSIATLARTDCPGTGGAFIYAAPPAEMELILPQLFRGLGDRQSMVALQNSDAEAPLAVTVELFEDSREKSIREYRLFLPAGGAELLRLDLDSSLPRQFSGWARVHAEGPVSAIVITDLEDGVGLLGLPGMTAGGLSEDLVVPALFRSYELPSLLGNGLKLDSYIEVLNPNDVSVTVEMLVRGNDDPELSEACRQFESTLPLESILPGSRLRTESFGLPDGCVASMLLHADGGSVAATFHVTERSRDQEEAFLAIPAAEASALPKGTTLNLELPMTRRNHTGSGLSTPIQILNLGAETATVQLQPFDSSGSPIACEIECAMSIPAGAARFWWPESVPNMADNSYGSTRIQSDQPLDTLVLDVSRNGNNDIAGYRGLDRAALHPSALPLVLNRGTLRAIGADPRNSPRPFLGLPLEMPEPSADAMTVPLNFESRGLPIQHVRFSLDLDERWLGFDPRDMNAIRSPLPESFDLVVEYNPDRSEAEIAVEIRPRDGVDAKLPAWVELQLSLSVEGPAPADEAGWLRFAHEPAPVMWGKGAVPVLPEVEGGWSPRLFRLLLPFLTKVGA